MLAPFVLLCLLVIPGCPDARAWAGAAPKAEVVSIGHPKILLWSRKQGPHHARQCGPRWTTGMGAGRQWRRILEDIQLVPEAAVQATQGLVMALAQEGLRADTSDGAGEVTGAAVPEGIVLRQATAQPAGTQRGLAGHKVHRGGIGSLVGHPRPRGKGGLGELATPAAWRARTGTQCHWAAFNPTTALDENWTSNLKRWGKYVREKRKREENRDRAAGGRKGKERKGKTPKCDMWWHKKMTEDRWDR